MKFRVKLIFLFCLVCKTIFAGSITYGNLTLKTVTKVHDGDTFKADIAGVHPIIGEGILIRIWGVDTPEITSKNAKEKALAIKAKEFVVNRLASAKKIQLVDVRRDKYFRILAQVFVDGCNLGDELIKEGLAVPYFGGTKNK